MGALKNELHKLCADNRDGSYATRADRLGVLLLCEEQLRDGGYGFKRARGLKPRHVEHLVQRWLGESLSVGTIKNRMAVLRWWAAKCGKASIIPRDNTLLGIPERKGSQGGRAKPLDLDKLALVACPRMRMSLRLMAAFGLRREEALKFRPRLADAGDCITLQPSWTKGGRPRTVPLLTQRQRALLDEAAELAGNDSPYPE